MSLKPVVLLYDLNNTLVDEAAALIGHTGLYTTINTYNEANAREAVNQYNRFFGLVTNKISCVVTGWNPYKKPSEQFLFQLRNQEKRSPLRSSTPVIMITEDHHPDLKRLALDPTDGAVAAYMHMDDFQDSIADNLHKIVFGNRAQELNSVAYAQFTSQEDTD